MKCKEIQKYLSDYLDEQLAESQREAVEGHLQGCQGCAAEVKAYRAILSEAAKLEKVAAPDSLWAAIESELDDEEGTLWDRVRQRVGDWNARISEVVRMPLPAIQVAGVAAILFIGILMGRYFWPNPQQTRPDQVAVAPDENYQMISRRTNDYFEKSRILFLGIVNADTSDIQNMDLSTERKVARGLVQEASFLKDNLNPSRDAVLARLVQELEMILITIANMEEEHDLDNIELIRSGIERQGVLLKINVLDFDAQRYPAPKRDKKPL